jgi:hypothetical protein
MFGVDTDHGNHPEDTIGVIVDCVNKVATFSDIQPPLEYMGAIDGNLFACIGCEVLPVQRYPHYRQASLFNSSGLHQWYIHGPLTTVLLC